MNNEQRRIIIGNWKMNPPTLEQAQKLFNSIKKGIGETKNLRVAICPPFIYLSKLSDVARPTKIKLGGQNCFWEQSGPFTGEVSPLMLKNLECEYVILGHSERRKHLGETDEMIAKKLKAALETGLKPILCIGETEQERKKGKTFEILKNQLNNDLKNLTPKIHNLKSFIIAYEPVWAIGTANACNPEEAKKILIFLKEGEMASRRISILYGGSVDSNNAKDYIGIGFEGLLAGSASLDAKEFVKIVKSLSNQIN